MHFLILDPMLPRFLAGLDLEATDVSPDGNCLFRSISMSLTGSEDSHLAIRQMAAVYMQDNLANFTDFFAPNNENEPHNIQEALSRIRQPGQWGSHADAVAIAQACHIDLYIWHPPLNGRNQSLRRVLEGNDLADYWHKYVILYDGLTHYRATNRNAADTALPTARGKPLPTTVTGRV